MTANNFLMSSDENAWPDGHAGDLAAYAAREYLLEHGWTTTVRGDEVMLPLGDGMVAVTVPVDWARLALADLRAMDLCCPVVLLSERHEAQAVFLLEGSADVRPDRLLPAWLWRPWPQEDIALPTGVFRGGISWLRPPEMGTRGSVTVPVLGRVLANLLEANAGDVPKSFLRTA